MQHHPYNFEYAIIRAVPQVEREEFINIGVILYCRDLDYLGMRYNLDEFRFKGINPYFNFFTIEPHLISFENIVYGKSDGGPIAELDKASRFRWLTAKRSTVVQTSSVHPGLCTEPEAKLNKLFSELVDFG